MISINWFNVIFIENQSRKKDKKMQLNFFSTILKAALKKM